MSDTVLLESIQHPIHANGDQAAPAARALPALTVEHLLYALVVVAGLLARLLLLGAAPLAAHEAAAAWAAWMDAAGLHPTAPPATAAALLHALQTFAFWIVGGGGEAAARLPVALISALIPLLPYFWRDQLGRVGALALALLLALDPWLLAFGRMADATALSVALALISLTALHIATRAAAPDAAAQRGRGAASMIGAAGAGLLVVSGPQAWSWLPLLALYLWLVADDRSAVLNGRVAAVAAAAALLGATGWLALPQELAMVSASLSEWLGVLRSGPYTVLWGGTRLLVDQPFVLVFGLIGLVLLWARPSAAPDHRRFLTIWLAWGLLLLLLPGRAPAFLPVIGVALAVCAALAIQRLTAAARALEGWAEAGLLALVLLAALGALWVFAIQLVHRTPLEEKNLLIAATLLGIVALLLAGFAYFVSPRQALLVGLGLLGLFFAAASLSAARHLAYPHTPAQPDGFFETITWPDAQALRADVRALSDRRWGDPTMLPVQVVTGPTQDVDPLLGWLLRDMANLSFVSAPVLAADSDPARAPLVIMAPQGDVPVWNRAYIGTTYRLRSAWLPMLLPPLTGYADGDQRWDAGWQPRLRWLLYRAAPSLPEAQTVNLWATP